MPNLVDSFTKQGSIGDDDMAKVFAQNSQIVLASSAALAANEYLYSGCILCSEYSTLVGMLWSNASSTASGLTIKQSSNYGYNYDSASQYTITASAASTFSIPIYGNAVCVSASNGATAASLFRALFTLRPI